MSLAGTNRLAVRPSASRRECAAQAENTGYHIRRFCGESPCRSIVGPVGPLIEVGLNVGATQARLGLGGPALSRTGLIDTEAGPGG